MLILGFPERKRLFRTLLAILFVVWMSLGRNDVRSDPQSPREEAITAVSGDPL